MSDKRNIAVVLTVQGITREQALMILDAVTQIARLTNETLNVDTSVGLGVPSQAPESRPADASVN